MDYENRLTTLKHLFDVLSQKIKTENPSNNTAQFKESKFHLQQIECEINRIAKMRFYKK